jgi:undecaprenyl phosphate-alpha-L-ara4FN deformylase
MRVALKVDVDTYHGLATGVPRVLDALRRRGVHASVYVAMGPDHSGRAVRRVLTHKGFARKMFASGALRLYGVRTMLYGTLLPGPQIARSFPGVLRRVLAEGHELGVHGYDHVYWHDRAVALGAREVTAEVDRALAVFSDLIGRAPDGFAAPGWQCSAASVACLDRRPFTYHSSTRGVQPYRPRIDGVEGRLPELPTTAPTLDELLGLGMRVDEATDAIHRSLTEDDLNVLTVHAEVEGGACHDAFAALLDRLAPRTSFVRLVDVARALDVAKLPVSPVVQGTRPGRAGTVSCQAG